MQDSEYNQRDEQERKQGYWIEPAKPYLFSLPHKDGRRETFRSEGVSAGWYVDDERHGKWSHASADGNIVEEGEYENGKKHGDWRARCLDKEYRETYRYGKRIT